jgi:tRNA (adenine22-N1)-methyltransferase
MQPLIHLDPRLCCIADQVPICGLAADIGADHGRLSCFLLESGRCKRMIVSDVSAVSRDKARALFSARGLSDRVELSSKDGLSAIVGKPEAVIISGMGGGLIAEILSRDVHLQSAKLILSAQTELPLMRDAVIMRGYTILYEHVVRAKGRFYLVLSALPGSARLTEGERLIGVRLRDTQPMAVRDYLLWQLSVASAWRGKVGVCYRAYLEEALAYETSNRPDLL